jgi:DNA-binding phage protein
MTRQLTDAELEAYLDEALTPEEMAAIEMELRGSTKLLKQLARIHSRRDAGVHSLGEIWRRHRVSCPAREQMGSFLLGVLDDAEADYIRFHLEVVACRVCHANLEDLRRRQAESNESMVVRRRKYFDSSAGYLRHP